MRELKQEDEYIEDLTLFAEQMQAWAVQQNKPITIHATPNDGNGPAWLDMRFGNFKQHKWEGGEWQRQ